VANQLLKRTGAAILKLIGAAVLVFLAFNVLADGHARLALASANWM
jgi:threonine/homoserine/homoserine lactone efflux protein